MYVVTCDWVKDYEGGIAVLGVTQNFKTAQRIMQEEIETEKREYWIDDVSPEDIAVLIEDEENCSSGSLSDAERRKRNTSSNEYGGCLR